MGNRAVARLMTRGLAMPGYRLPAGNHLTIQRAPWDAGPVRGPAAPEVVRAVVRQSVIPQLQAARAALAQEKPNAAEALGQLVAARDGIGKVASNVQRGLDGMVDDLIEETRSHLEIAISQIEPYTGFKHPIREIADALESHLADLRMLDRRFAEGPPRTPGSRAAVMSTTLSPCTIGR